MATLPKTIEFVVPAEHAGKRLDRVLHALLPEKSRTKIQRLVVDGCVLVDGQPVQRPSAHVRAGSGLRVALPASAPQRVAAENIPLNVLYEDRHIAAVDKPAGLVTHPTPGVFTGTLVNAILFRFKSLSTLRQEPDRPGIVHRLDRDTSGVLLVAKTERAHADLSRQFRDRLVHKEYLAVARGSPPEDRFQVDAPLDRHHMDRRKVTVAPDCGRVSRTDFVVLRRYAQRWCLISASPRSGRRHQIRVHLLHAGHPILCDRLYAPRHVPTRGDLGLGGARGQRLIQRHALHARRIRFTHPESGAPMTIEAPVPDDLRELVDALAEFSGQPADIPESASLQS